MRLVLICILAIFAFRPTQVLSWSLETHLYVGTRVLEDLLPDGAVSLCATPTSAQAGIDCARQYKIPTDVYNAIRQNPGSFLAGTLGPDVYPDFITGQVTTHPGVIGGWQADGWLRHILQTARSAQEVAWVYGYLSHASGDIFAHTWVNHYAGDIFDLNIHQQAGNEVEVRHFTLERYVADRTPRIWEQLGSWSAPHEFVADQLVLDNGVATQYKRAKIPGHLVAIESAHESVTRVHDEAKRLGSKILEIGLERLSPLKRAEGALANAERTLQAAQVGLKLAGDALALQQKLIDEARVKLASLAKLIDENPELIFGWRRQIVAYKATAEAAEATFGALGNAVHDARSRVEQLQGQLNNINQHVTETVCKRVLRDVICLGGLIPGCRDVFDDVCETVSKINPAWAAINGPLEVAKASLSVQDAHLNAAHKVASDARNLIQDLDKRIQSAEQQFTDAKIARTALLAELQLLEIQQGLKRKAVEESNKVLAAAEKELARVRAQVAQLQNKLQPVADLLARYHPIILFLSHWKDDLRRATIAFSETSEVVASRIVNKSSESRLGPYREWFECWTPVLAAVPSEVPQTICVARAEYLAFKDRLDEEINDFVNSLGALGWLLAPNVKLQQEFDKRVRQPLENEVKKALNRARDETIAFLANRQLSELIRLMDSGERITDAALNGIYASDDSNSKLLLLGDVAERARRDMGLSDENKQVSESSFAALYNAIILSKLALLAPTELNAIHRDLTGQDSSVYGATLYAARSGGLSSLLDGAVRSIDGNHQWQRVALPYPRSQGSDPGWRDKRHYGQAGAPGESGFRYWGDRNARDAVFKRIFRGPMNPGLEDHPSMAGKYPFPSCASNPFPSTTDVHGQQAPSDLTCTLVAESVASGLPGQFSALSVREFRSRELRGLSAWDLRIARNEIFARRGFTFGPPELQAYFSAQAWYQPSGKDPEDVADMLSSLEWHNVFVIESLERGIRRGMPPPTSKPVLSMQ